MTRKFWIVLILIVIAAGVIPAVLAQDAPPGIFQTAVRAANAAQPGLGETGSWTFELLGKTRLSSLGCPLVTGTDLGREVTPYRVSLTYPGGQYIVYVSTDGSLVQLCDPKFGTVSASTPAPATGCELSAAADPAARLAPDSDAAVINSGGVLKDGKTVAIGRSAQKSWYQVQTLNQAIAWVDAAQVTATGNCDSVPITALPDPDYDGNTCYVTPASGFSNVRQRPSTDNAVVGQIYEGTYWQVFVRNTAGDWYFINPGWISLRVVQSYGICEGLETNNELVGVGADFMNTPGATPVPGATLPPLPPAQTTPIPSQFVCPTGLAGYMPPRLVRGAGNARVTPGDTPNRLRSEPNVASAQVGQAQPERVLDAVLNGPACSGTYVWWLVEIDGVQGWTAESDASTNTYFLEPLGVAPVPTAVVVGPAATATATPGSISSNPAQPTSAPGGGDTTGALAILTQQNGVDATQAFFSADGKNILAFSQGDSFLQMWDVTNLSSVPDPIGFPLENPPKFVSTALSADTLAILTEDKIIHTYDFPAFTLNATVFNVDTPSPIAFSPDGKLMLTVACNNADCTQGRIDLRDTTDGHVLRSQPAHNSLPGGAVFSPDGARIASWGNDGIQVWDTQSGAFVTGVAKTPADAAASNVLFSADSTQLIQGLCTTMDGTTCKTSVVVFYNAATGAEVARTAEPSDGAIDWIALTSDGLTLATLDKTANKIRVWDTVTKQLTAEMAGGAVIAFSPDGRLLVTKGSAAGTLAVYNVPVPNSAG